MKFVSLPALLGATALFCSISEAALRDDMSVPMESGLFGTTNLDKPEPDYDSYTPLIARCSRSDNKERACNRRLGCKYVYETGECVNPDIDPTDMGMLKRRRRRRRRRRKQTPKTKILFIGNSFTYRNKMPLDIFSRICSSKGKAVTVVDNGKQGGSTLGFHTVSTVTKQALNKYDQYDYIVLQEQSMMLSFEDWSTRYTQTYRFVPEWVKIINGKQAKPVLFETWGYFNGFGGYDTYNDMQDRLLAGYKDFKEEFDYQELNAVIAPAGEAWRMAHETMKMQMYDVDGQHPKAPGSYIAALTIYCTIFGDSPVGAWRPSSVNSSQAARMQEWAWRACKENI